MRDRLSISRICSILILVTLLLSTTSIVTGTMSSENNSIGRSEFSISQEYTPHENIWIKSDSELLTLAANEGWVGTGTKENPIIIEGYSFFDTEMQPVRFWDTTLHWIFRSNRVSTATEWCGIWALRTQNGIVSNNTFDACHSGAYLEHVQGMIIENNTFQHNTGSGVDGDNPVSDLIIRNNEIYDQNVDGIIFKYPATNVTIINNYIHDNTYDTIDIQFGEDITIQDNVMKNHRYGIKIGNTVTGCIVEENTIQNILNSGIYISGDDNEITNNVLRNIGANGIILQEDEGEYPEDNIISRNTIINCTKFGVLVEADSEGNLIQNNDFFDSGESCHICDDGTGTMIQDNFYDIWSLPDADADGTVDIPYTILGLAGNSDPTPEAEPVNAIPEDYNYVPMTPTQPGDIDIDLGIIMIGAGIGVVVCLLAIVVVKKR